MSSRRIAKVAEALRETISMAVLFEVNDPRVKNVTVLRTEVSPDLKSARVFVSVMGDERAQSLAMHGLRSARGFIQSRIADRLELRYTPILQFVLDQGVKLSVQASAIIREALADDSTEHGATDDGAGGHDGTVHDTVRDDVSGDDTDVQPDASSENAESAAGSDEAATKTKF